LKDKDPDKCTPLVKFPKIPSGPPQNGVYAQFQERILHKVGKMALFGFFPSSWIDGTTAVCTKFSNLFDIGVARVALDPKSDSLGIGKIFHFLDQVSVFDAKPHIVRIVELGCGDPDQYPRLVKNWAA